MKSIFSYIQLLTKESPSSIIFYTPKKEYTRKDFLDKIIRCANNLINENSIKSNDKIILYAQNTFEFICCYFAVHAAGAICVPIDPLIPLNQFNYILKIINPKLVIKDPNLFVSLSSSAICSSRALIPSNYADITFTSGSTGNPKGVLHTHSQQVKVSDHIIENVGNIQTDKEILLMPLSHSFALGRMRSCMVKGTALILGYSLQKIGKLFKAIEKYHVTGFGIVPSGWEYLIRLSGQKISNFKNQLKYIEMGSAPFSSEQKRKMKSLLPETKIVMHYGLTEVSRALFVDFNKDPDYAVGNISGNTNVRIIDENCKLLNEGEEGEIVLRSSWMFKEYYRDPELTKKSFKEGFFRTGDLGIINGNYLKLSGRIKEIINVGGKKVMPSLVESVINKIPGIIESACISIPDNFSGEAIKAYLVLSPKTIFDEDKINQLMKNSLPNHMLPKQYECIKSIPKTSNGKLQRLKLKLFKSN